MDFRGDITHPDRTLWFHQRMTSSKQAWQSKICLDGIRMIHGYWSASVRIDNL